MIAIGAKDSLPYLIYQTTGGTWYWHGKLPDPNGVQFSALATGPGNGGSLQVVLIGAKDSLPYLIYQTTSGNWIWHGKLPDPNGVQFSAVAAGPGNNGYLQVILIGAKDSLPYLIWQDGGGGWNWAGQRLDPNGVRFSAIAAGPTLKQAFTYLEVVGIGATDQLANLIWQDRDGKWTWWGPMCCTNVPLKAIAGDSANFSYYAYGCNEWAVPWILIGLGANDGLPYAYYINNEDYCAGNLYRGQLPDPGVPFSALAMGDGNNQWVQVIGLGASDGLPYLIWADDTGNWYWHGQLPDPGVPFSAIATGTGNGGSLQVILIGANDGLPYLIYQTTSGTWYWHGKLPDP